MGHSKYLVIGGGMTGDAAVRGIRELDPDNSITLLSAETAPPYKRPPLSKGLWTTEQMENIWLDTEAQGVELHLGRRVEHLDPEFKRVVDDQGAVYTFDKLLLATGATPRRLPFGGDGIIYYRSLADYQRLRELTQRGRRLAVIGGGFIGWEMAAALAMNGLHVVMVFPEATIGQRIYPRELGHFLNDYYRERGVEVLAETAVLDASQRGQQWVVRVRESGSERDIIVDGVVAGIGVTPNVGLAEAAGLAVSNGIVTDEYLRTSHPDIYAAGDVAAFLSSALGKRVRLEHEDNATHMGRQAGRNMADADEPYHHLPFFYSDLFELGYEAVGDLDANLETVADWKEPYHEGTIYYLRDGHVRGVLLWNVWEQVDAARQMIMDGAPAPMAEAQPQAGGR